MSPAIAAVRQRLRGYRRRLRNLYAAPAGVDRLVPSPVLVVADRDEDAVELLALLSGHPQVCVLPALPELQVRLERHYSQLAVERLGLSEPELGHLLADRLVQRELGRSGAQVVAAPAPASRRAQLRAAWPEAREVRVVTGTALPATGLSAAVLLTTSRWRSTLTVGAGALRQDPDAVLLALARFLGLPRAAPVPSHRP